MSRGLLVRVVARQHAKGSAGAGALAPAHASGRPGTRETVASGALLAEFDERLGWAEWGVKSCAHWLSWRCSITPRAAREHLRVARRLTELPLLREAFAAGELSYSKVRAVTRVASAGTEEQLVELARHATGGQLDRLVRGYGKVLAATVDQVQKTHESRRLSYDWEDDGTLSLRARLPADDGALLLKALEAVQQHTLDPRPYGDDEHEGAPNAVAGQADALVALARRALAGEDGREPLSCELVVHVDAATLAGDAVVERAELADGPALAPETIRRLGCDAAVVGIVERDGRPLSVGRRTRAVPPALRRALRTRDHGCRFPGCLHTRYLHAHHIQHWARGGATDLENLIHLCSHHHRLVHEGGFSVQRTGRTGLAFRRPDGRLIPENPRPRRGSTADLCLQHRRSGLLIDDHTCVARSAGDSLDYGIAVQGLIARELAGT